MFLVFYVYKISTKSAGRFRRKLILKKMIKTKLVQNSIKFCSLILSASWGFGINWLNACVWAWAYLLAFILPLHASSPFFFTFISRRARRPWISTGAAFFSCFLLGQRPQRADVLWDTGVNFHTSVRLYIRTCVRPPPSFLILKFPLNNMGNWQNANFPLNNMGKWQNTNFPLNNMERLQKIEKCIFPIQ